MTTKLKNHKVSERYSTIPMMGLKYVVNFIFKANSTAHSADCFKKQCDHKNLFDSSKIKLTTCLNLIIGIVIRRYILFFLIFFMGIPLPSPAYNPNPERTVVAGQNTT